MVGDTVEVSITQSSAIMEDSLLAIHDCPLTHVPKVCTSRSPLSNDISI